MKTILFLLLLPLLSISQTAHVDDGEIEYKGDVNVPGLSATEILFQVQKVVPTLVENFKKNTNGNPLNTLIFNGEFLLPTPYTHIRKVYYTMQLKTNKGKYDYRIDSVYLIEHRRGSKPETKTSEKLVDEIEVGGSTTINAEIVLNQIDMKIQELLAKLQAKLEKP